MEPVGAPAEGGRPEHPAGTATHTAWPELAGEFTHLLSPVFAVLGPTEAVASLSAFAAALVAGGWSWGTHPSPAPLAMASGTAFATIAGWLGAVTGAVRLLVDAAHTALRRRTA